MGWANIECRTYRSNDRIIFTTFTLPLFPSNTLLFRLGRMRPHILCMSPRGSVRLRGGARTFILSLEGWIIIVYVAIYRVKFMGPIPLATCLDVFLYVQYYVCIMYTALLYAHITVPFVVANLSDAVDDRLDSVDVDGGSGVLPACGGLLCSTTSAAESSSDSLSDDSMAASTCTQRGATKSN